MMFYVLRRVSERSRQPDFFEAELMGAGVLVMAVGCSNGQVWGGGSAGGFCGSACGLGWLTARAVLVVDRGLWLGWRVGSWESFGVRFASVEEGKCFRGESDP